jgi:2-polyprenyl-3-methyl-5-hydroxy-6-metoxy-1,4-benzoquinol methylase
MALQVFGNRSGKKLSVLDVGCATGYLGKEIMKEVKGIDVFGVEVDCETAREAKKFYSEVIIKDLNSIGRGSVGEINEIFRGRRFDLIIFADVLEHLINPSLVLAYFVNNYLKKGGKIIISLPNVAHLSIRLNLLLGRFEYTQMGILDKTHLRLYTLASAKKMIKESGLVVEKILFSSNRFGWLIKLFPFLGTVLGFNLIFLCRKK